MQPDATSERGFPPATPHQEPSASAPFDPQRLSLSVLAIATAAMLALSWQRWTDPLIDFGREIYLPWRVLSGDLLYRDLEHFYSPLSVYVNAGWLSLFGVSIRSLYAGNLVLLLACGYLLYRVLRQFADLAVTVTSMLFVLLVFPLSRYGTFGNYTFLSPYSHEITHGLVLSLATLAALGRYFETRSRVSLAVCGLALGLVFLTKYEVFFAAFGAVALGLAACWWMQPRTRVVGDAVLLAACGAVPFLVCWGLLGLYLPVGTALRGALGPYPYLFRPEISQNVFYAKVAGLETLGASLEEGGAWLIVYTAAILPAAFLGLGPLRLNERVYAVTALLLPPVMLSLPLGHLRGALMPLPVLAIISTFVAARPCLTRQPVPTPGRLLRLTLSTFALLLLAKVFFNVHLGHYAFVLALPAVVLTAVMGLGDLPAWLDSRQLNGPLTRLAVGSLLASLAVMHVTAAARVYGTQMSRVADGADLMRADGRGAVVDQAVALVKARVAPDQTLAVLPEGAGVNYLASRRTSVPYIVFDPIDLEIFNEETVVRSLQAHPPDHVLLFSRDVRDFEEFGCMTFGQDCATRVGAWLRGGYVPRAAVQYQGRRLVTLFARKDAAPAAPLELIEMTFRR